MPVVAPWMEGNPDLTQPGLTETNSLAANAAAAPVGPVRFPWPLGTLKHVYATQPSRDRGVLNLEAHRGTESVSHETRQERRAWRGTVEYRAQTPRRQQIISLKSKA